MFDKSWYCFKMFCGSSLVFSYQPLFDDILLLFDKKLRVKTSGWSLVSATLFGNNIFVLFDSQYCFCCLTTKMMSLTTHSIVLKCFVE